MPIIRLVRKSSVGSSRLLFAFLSRSHARTLNCSSTLRKYFSQSSSSFSSARLLKVSGSESWIQLLHGILFETGLEWVVYWCLSHKAWYRAFRQKNEPSRVEQKVVALQTRVTIPPVQCCSIPLYLRVSHEWKEHSSDSISLNKVSGRLVYCCIVRRLFILSKWRWY